jgi:exopolysaccharide biosynthesis polyprenyl glycosylphosphotransferase
MAQDFTHLVHAHPEWGLKIVGFIDFDTQNVGKEVLGYKILGTPKDIPEIFHKEVIDEVVFALHRKYLDLLDETLKLCEEEGIGAHIALADWFHVSISKTQFENFHGLPMITFNPIPLTEMQLFIKGIFDRVCALILLILFSPIFLITAIAIKLTSKGPVFFKQPRCGIHGRQFIMYKFRSMVNGADKQLESLKHKNEMSGPVFKMKDDPRITPLGKFLRRTSIDELPQLINVLKGDMSLVGPRPLMPWEVAGFDKWQRRRMSMPPGITCIWQVNGRNHIDFDKWMKLDLQYIDNWSFALDAKLLLQTIPAVLFKKGAC